MKLLSSILALNTFSEVSGAKQCEVDSDFLRHCDANGGWQTTLYDLTAAECRTECEGFADCVKAHHHPGNQIWENDDRTNCWLWSSLATGCDWNGGETAKFHPGATMIRCHDTAKPSQCSDITGETGTGVFKIYPFGNESDKLSVFCDFNSSPAATYLNVDPDTNYSRWTADRLHGHAGHLCSSTWMQDDWDKAGWSVFRKIRLNISDDGVTIDRSDLTYAKGKNQKEYGTAGDCYSWNECGDARKGNFQIDLTGRGVDIDWTRTGEWKANAWGNGNFMVDFKSTADMVSANCGGWCGECAPSTDIYLVADGTAPPPPPERGMAVSRNNLYSTIPTLHKQWSLSVDIKPTGTVYGWSNVLHVGIGGDHETYGDRTPGIWFHSDSTKLHIPSAINGNSNYITNTDALPMNEWTRVDVTQFKNKNGDFDFTISIGGNVAHTMTNSDPEEFNDVKVYTSDNYYSASKARIDNLRISSFASGSTKAWATTTHLGYMDNNAVVTGAAKLRRGVKIAVESENDIHISLAGSDIVTTDDWEIVLGGWSGTKSVIRSSHQGDNLATVQHTKGQFLEWQQNFELKMAGNKIGLYDAEGAPIIEYDQFDSTGIGYMFIATGFGSTGNWVINVQDDGFDYGEDPQISLEKKVARFKTYLDDNFKPAFISAIGGKLDKVAEKMISKFERLNEKCDIWQAPEEEEDDGLRYDQNDPCKAAKQLPKGIMKWSGVYNVNCRNPSKAGFHDRVQADMDKIQERLIKKLKFC